MEGVRRQLTEVEKLRDENGGIIEKLKQVLILCIYNVSAMELSCLSLPAFMYVCLSAGDKGHS